MGLASNQSAIPSGPAGGDLTGTYPNPTVAKINGTALGTLSGATAGQSLVWNGSAWVPQSKTVPDTFQVTTLTLTSAQVLAIHTAPVTIVSAPGAGLALIPMWAIYNYTYVTTPYLDGGGNLTILAGTGSVGAGLATASAGFWDQIHSELVYKSGGVAATALSALVNGPLVVSNSVANPTLGNGTLTVTVAYVTVAAS